MKQIKILLLILFLLNACGSARDAFTLKKKSSVDEFLVEKKSPLVLPPDYGKLPVPNDNVIDKTASDKKDIKVLVTKNKKNLSPKIEKNSKPTSIEKSILEKIK
jgi:hypothetical protein